MNDNNLTDKISGHIQGSRSCAKLGTCADYGAPLKPHYLAPFEAE